MKNLISMAAIGLLQAFGAIVRNDAEMVERLNEKLLDINGQSEAIQARADAEQRPLTEDEEAEIEALFVEFRQVENDIKRRENINAQTVKLQERLGRQSDDNPNPGASAAAAAAAVGEEERPGRAAAGGVRIDNSSPRGRWGWRSFGEFAAGVRNASSNGGTVDPRLLQNAPTTFSSEGVGADGGFAVPPDFRTTIMEAVLAETSLLSRTDQMTSGSNSIVLPIDETTNWQTAGGVQAYWEGESEQLNQSKLALKSDTIRLNKLTALIPVTEELMEDSSALDSYLRKKVPAKFDFKINDAIVNGTGAGMPRGFMNSGSLITVAKESGQSADTIVFENIVNMWSRMYGASRPGAAWLINQDIEPQLLSMGFPTSATAVPVYLPPGGLSASPYGTLMGRPVLPSQAMQTLGDKGDIALVDLNQYLTVVKTGGIRTDVSMHLWFDYDTLAYRFIFRVAGQSWLGSVISPKNGSNSVSPFITLAARA